jgi:hypothetical protein
MPHRPRANFLRLSQPFTSPAGRRVEGLPAHRWIKRHRERTQKSKGGIGLGKTFQL